MSGIQPLINDNPLREMSAEAKHTGLRTMLQLRPHFRALLTFRLSYFLFMGSWVCMGSSPHLQELWVLSAWPRRDEDNAGGGGVIPCTPPARTIYALRTPRLCTPSAPSHQHRLRHSVR